MPRNTCVREPAFDALRAPWRTSSYSGGVNSECVEVAPDADRVGVRDSKNPSAGHLTVGRGAWRSFVASRRLRPRAL